MIIIKSEKSDFNRRCIILHNTIKHWFHNYILLYTFIGRVRNTCTNIIRIMTLSLI